MKIHNRIIYLFISVFVLYTVLFSAFIYYSISRYAYTDFYKRLEIRAAITAKIKLENPNDVNSIKEVGQEYLEKLPNQIEYIIPIKSLDESNDSLRKALPEGLIDVVLKEGFGNDNLGHAFFSGILYQTRQGERYIVVVSAENYFYSHHIVYLKNP